VWFQDYFQSYPFGSIEDVFLFAPNQAAFASMRIPFFRVGATWIAALSNASAPTSAIKIAGLDLIHGCHSTWCRVSQQSSAIISVDGNPGALRAAGVSVIDLKNLWVDGYFDRNRVSFNSADLRREYFSYMRET